MAAEMDIFVEEDPIEEVYRVRKEIMDEFDWDVAKYHEHLRAQRSTNEAMGAKYVSLKNRR
ncbi:hypothetical protein R80B4_01725 [Fibrobacteres bacterium R8-0-B4]